MFADNLRLYDLADDNDNNINDENAETAHRAAGKERDNRPRKEDHAAADNGQRVKNADENADKQRAFCVDNQHADGDLRNSDAEDNGIGLDELPNHFEERVFDVHCHAQRLLRQVFADEELDAVKVYRDKDRRDQADDAVEQYARQAARNAGDAADDLSGEVCDSTAEIGDHAGQRLLNGVHNGCIKPLADLQHPVVEFRDAGEHALLIERRRKRYEIHNRIGQADNDKRQQSADDNEQHEHADDAGHVAVHMEFPLHKDLVPVLAADIARFPAQRAGDRTHDRRENKREKDRHHYVDEILEHQKDDRNDHRPVCNIDEKSYAGILLPFFFHKNTPLQAAVCLVWRRQSARRNGSARRCSSPLSVYSMRGMPSICTRTFSASSRRRSSR